MYTIDILTLKSLTEVFSVLLKELFCTRVLLPKFFGVVFKVNAEIVACKFGNEVLKLLKYFTILRQEFGSISWFNLLNIFYVPS